MQAGLRAAGDGVGRAFGAAFDDAPRRGSAPQPPGSAPRHSGSAPRHSGSAPRHLWTERQGLTQPRLRKKKTSFGARPFPTRFYQSFSTSWISMTTPAAARRCLFRLWPRCPLLMPGRVIDAVPGCPACEYIIGIFPSFRSKISRISGPPRRQHRSFGGFGQRQIASPRLYDKRLSEGDGDYITAARTPCPGVCATTHRCAVEAACLVHGQAARRVLPSVQFMPPCAQKL
jgi:hypothetical protein